MTLEDWFHNRWLKKHKTSKDEVANLLQKVDIGIEQTAIQEIVPDWRLRIAYDASLTIATIALRVSGFRISSGEGHHIKTIESLKYTLQASNDIIITLQAIRKKRNNVSYDAGGTVSETEVAEAINTAKDLKYELHRWLKEIHPEYLE